MHTQQCPQPFADWTFRSTELAISSMFKQSSELHAQHRTLCSFAQEGMHQFISNTRASRISSNHRHLGLQIHFFCWPPVLVSHPSSTKSRGCYCCLLELQSTCHHSILRHSSRSLRFSLQKNPGLGAQHAQVCQPVMVLSSHQLESFP